MLKRKMWYKDAASVQPVYSFGDNKINFENLECHTIDSQIRLTQQEAMVLKYLIDNKGKIVSRKELIEKVWHMNPDIETRTVDNFIVGFENILNRILQILYISKVSGVRSICLIPKPDFYNVEII